MSGVDVGGRPPTPPDELRSLALTTLEHRSGSTRPGQQLGATLWFTGLPSAGKSTVAHALADRLRADKVDVEVLDGDEVRPHLSAGLGFSRADRDINVARIGWVARLLAAHGTVVLVPVIAPYAEARQVVRDDHAAHGVAFGEVFVSTSLAVAEGRDVKGLYARARAGEISGMTGVDDPYEAPESADLVLDTAALELDVSVALASDLLAVLTGGPATSTDRTPSRTPDRRIS